MQLIGNLIKINFRIILTIFLSIILILLIFLLNSNKKTTSLSHSHKNYTLDVEHNFYKKPIPSDFKYLSCETSFGSSYNSFSDSSAIVIFWASGCSFCYDLLDYIDLLNIASPITTNIITVDATFINNNYKLGYEWISQEISLYCVNKSDVDIFLDHYEIFSVPTIWIVYNGIIYGRFSGYNENAIFDFVYGLYK